MPNNSNKIPEATIHRLPVYLQRLKAMQAKGVAKVSSRLLAQQLRIKPSQLRHDFHHFGGFSRPGQPYDVEHIIQRLQDILALSMPVKYVIAGAGHLGQAIASYAPFEQDGFELAGLFDINPRLIGLDIRGIVVQDLSTLPEIVQAQGVKLGVITTPPSSAQPVADLMVQAGVQGIWNFASANLELPENIVLCDEFLSVGIMSLRYKVMHLENGGPPVS